MLYLEFLLLSLCAGFLLYEKTVSLKRQEDEYSAVLSLLIYIKGGLASERLTPAQMIASFSERSEAQNIPWLSQMLESTTSFMRDRRLLSCESRLLSGDKERIASFFADFGKSIAEEESKRLDTQIASLTKKSAELSLSFEKNSRAWWILFTTAVLGLLIIIL